LDTLEVRYESVLLAVRPANVVFVLLPLDASTSRKWSGVGVTYIILPARFLEPFN